MAYPVLPSIRALAGAEELARGVDRIELGAARRAASPEERRRHAALLRDLLVAINAEYRRKHGTPPPPQPAARGLEQEARDVEMIAV